MKKPGFLQFGASAAILLLPLAVSPLHALKPGQEITYWVHTTSASKTSTSYRVDFSMSSPTSDNNFDFLTWTNPYTSATGVKYFDIAPYANQVASCIEVTMRNDYLQQAAYVPDWIALVYTGSVTGWQLLADDNNTIVPRSTPGGGTRLPAFRISGQGYTGAPTGQSFVRITSYTNSPQDNAGSAIVYITRRNDLTQQQCEEDTNWPVVRLRFNGSYSEIIRYGR